MTTDLTTFKAALAKGSGRAMILMRDGDRAGFGTALLEACTVNQTHDGQCEADRTPYLARLAVASGEIGDLYDRLLNRVEHWGDAEADILFPLTVLGRLALADPGLDRDRLTAALEALDEEDQIDAADIRIELEGYPGFRRALDLLAPRFDDEGWQAEGWLEVLRARDGPSIDPVLRSDSEGDPLLARLLAAEAESRPEPPVAEPMTLEDLRAALQAGKPSFRTGRQRSEAELAVLAADLAGIDDVPRARSYLKLFARLTFAGDPAVLMRWRNSADAKTRHFARMALARMKHWAVRALALDRLEAGETWALGLLKENYQLGDHRLIAAVLGQPMGAEEAHRAAMAVLDILGRHGIGDEGRAALLTLYDLTPCSYCRRDIVEALDKAGPLPDWLAEECRFDADPDTVALVSA